MGRILWGIKMTAEYEHLRMDEFKTYASLIHLAAECRERAHKKDSALERGQLLAAAYQYEEEAHALAAMDSDNLLFF